MTPAIHQTVDTFFAAYPLRHLERGRTLFWPDEPIPGVAHVEEGSVGQYHIGPDGQKVLLNTFKPPAFFPVWATLGETKSPYFFDTLEPLVYRLAPHDAVLGFLKQNPEVTLNLLARVYRGTDGLLRRQAELMAGTAQSRLIVELLIYAARFGTSDTGLHTSFRIKTTELAERTGLTRETVSRQLKYLSEQAVIGYHTGMLTIRDAEKLEALLS
ncbi:Crp/Fnr family transcriptional regulator [Candidatus Saccharibacteria bacterium]|nr:MAG: Crp/Fnr family transcriptional regulator [Candidatus Saccharibacteria bacterium]